MTGWAAPDAPAPIVGWEAPQEPEGLGVRESIGAGWRVLRAHVGTLAATAALPEILRNLMVVPSILVVARAWQAMIDIFTTTDWSNYTIDDQTGLQQRLEDAFRPPTDLAIVSGLASGASIGIALIGWSLVTAATLAAIDGRRPTVGGAYREVGARAGALIVPAVIIGIAWALIGTPLTLSQGAIAFSDASMRTQAAIGAVFGLVGLIVSVAAIILGVRWSLAIPAILAEDLSLRRGLSRSAELTAGIRVRIFLIVLVLAIVIGVLFSVVALLVAAIVGLATFSLAGGIAGYLVVATIAGFFWLPMGAAVLSHIYRLRAGPAGGAAVEGGIVPDPVGETTVVPGAGAGDAVVPDAVAEGPAVDDPPPSA